LAAVFSFSASAQTVQIRTSTRTGAEGALQAAKENARKRNAPSAIAVVDFAGDLLTFERMDGVRVKGLVDRI
jgi:glc operon protein GlcG